MAEFDKGYAEYHRKWKGRLGLKDVHLAKGYMQGEALKIGEHKTLSPDPSLLDIHVYVDGRGLDAQADRGALLRMILEWQDIIIERDEDNPQEFTKRFICETVALNRHLDSDNGELVISAALWLGTANPDAMDALVKPGSGLLVEMTLEGTRDRRTKISLVPPAHPSLPANT